MEKETPPLLKSNEIKRKAEREQWSNRREFFLSCLAYTVGLGNVWRFPYLCFQNGGGAFLVPYIILACVMGLPMMFMEMSIGQFTKRSTIKVYNLVPVMRGIGIASFITRVLSTFYYTIVLAWGVLYFFSSFTINELPWATCGNWWNTDSCIAVNNISKSDHGENDSMDSIDVMENRTLSVDEFWNNFTLQKSTGINHIGSLSNWRLYICFALTWIVCYLCIFRGIKAMGKIVYFTALFPYLLLLILAIKGCTLEGAGKGIYFFLVPVFSRLLDVNVWFQAGGQILYTYGIGFCTLTVFASYNDFNTNCFRNSVGLVSSGALASLMAGLGVFGVLGHMSHVTGRNVSEVVASGPGLAFQAFPAALALMPLSQLWSILFFSMIIMVGVDSVFSSIEATAAIIADFYPEEQMNPRKKRLIITIVCAITAVLGFVFTVGNGIYTFEIFNKFTAGAFTLFTTVLLECVTFTYIYGIEKFFQDVRLMMGGCPEMYLKCCYMFVIPIITTTLLIGSIVQYKPLTMDGYIYPTWAYVFGWLISLLAILAIPSWMVYKLLQYKGGFVERWRKSIQPSYGKHIIQKKQQYKELQI